MKKFKILFAVITVVAMLFTVASASVLKFGAETVEYTEGDLTISVYAAEDINYSAGGTFELVFDNTVWAFKGATFDSAVTADGFVAGEDGTGMPNAISACISTGTAKTIAANQKIVDLTFEKIAGDAIGTKFELDFNVFGGNFLDGTGTPMDFSGAITVKAAGPTTVAIGEVKATAGNITIGETTYSGVAVVTSAVPADVDFIKAGFEWVNGTTTEFDASALSGAGTLEFSAAVYGAPEGFEVVADAYYVK